MSDTMICPYCKAIITLFNDGKPIKCPYCSAIVERPEKVDKKFLDITVSKEELKPKNHSEELDE